MDEDKATRETIREGADDAPTTDAEDVEGHAVRDQTREAVREEFDATREEADVEGHAFRGQVRDAVRDAVRDEPGAVRDEPGRDM